MKTICVIMLILIFSTMGFAQNNVSQPLKFALVDSSAFYDEKTGITDLVEARKKWKQEFESQAKELNLMTQQIEKSRQEIFKLIIDCNSDCEKNIQSKITEHQLLVDKYVSQEKLFTQSINLRESVIVGAVRKKIGELAKQFMKVKGYDLLLDATKDNQEFMTGSAINDVTNEFIDLCNEEFEKTKKQ